ncbi:MAG: efflux RND transporter periplasmic adaptor subunit, partial [Desulfosarcina sp.]
SYSARLASDNEAVVIARVSGVLEKRHFEPGARVEQGDPLYTIEPAPYQALVGQREADLQAAEAQVGLSRREAVRYKTLARENAVSQQERDQAVAQLRVDRSRVAQARAALESARIDQDYTQVRAPVAGMISLSQVNVGNVVDPGTPLATITPLEPLEVRFRIPQEDAFHLRRQRKARDEPIEAVLEFPALRSSEQDRLRGRLDFLGSRVERDTSTVQARARFDNPDGFFVPGQFVRVRLEGLKRYDVLAVPEIAVTQGLMGPQVFVLDESDKATPRGITPGELAGAWQIISDGLDPGDRVIVSDTGGLQTGTAIDPQPFSGDPEKMFTPAPSPSAPQSAPQTSADDGAGQTRVDGAGEKNGGQ